MTGSETRGNKKAQISGQVFVYVLAAVVIGLLLFIGVKAITSIATMGSRVNLDSLKSDFQSNVETISRQYGSVKKIELNIPNAFDEICFVDAMEDDGEFKFATSVIANDIIRGSVESGTKDNVFLMKKGVWDDKFIAYNLDVQTDYLCIENSGDIEVWLKGTGKKALLYTK